MTHPARPARPLVALNAPRRIPELMVYARSIALAMNGNARFPAPLPSMTAFDADLSALEAAHVQTLTRAVGTAAERDRTLARVHADLDSLRAYVQTIADASAGDGAEAAVVVASAGMSLKRSSGHAKATFAVKQGPVSGSVRLYGKAPKARASYDWQRSQDGVTWVDLPWTMRADTAVSGLVAGTRHSFRYRTLTKDGASGWSDVVSLLVV